MAIHLLRSAMRMDWDGGMTAWVLKNHLHLLPCKFLRHILSSPFLPGSLLVLSLPLYRHRRRRRRQTPFTTHESSTPHSPTMSELDKKEKESTPPVEEQYEKGAVEGTTHSVHPTQTLYDPSKESVWTRLGVTLESFKRAPGTTGYVPSLFLSQPGTSRHSGDARR